MFHVATYARRLLTAALMLLLPVVHGTAKTTVAELGKQLSTFQTTYNCSVAEPTQRQEYIVCTYNYLALYNGTVYFMHPNASVRPPDVNVDWMLGAILGLHNIPSLSALNLPPSTPVTTIDQSMLTFFTFNHNFYHVFAEYMPTVHTVLCRYLGQCSYNPDSQLQMIMVDDFDIRDDRWHQPIDPALSRCVSSLPVKHVRSPQWEGQLVLLVNTIAGWGREARVDHGHMHHWGDRHPPARYMMQQWRERLAACLGFDARRTAPTEPVHIVIVDRVYGGGRTFLNIDDMVEMVKQKYPQAMVTLKYLEGASLEETAHAFDDATVVIWQHGAAMANLIFLPEGASGIQVVMRDRPHELLGWPDELVRDVPNSVQLVHMINTDPGKMLLRPELFRWSQEWDSRTIQEKLAIWEQKQCPEREYTQINHVCEEWWFKIGASLEVDLDRLEEALELVMPSYMPKASSKRSRH